MAVRRVTAHSISKRSSVWSWRTERKPRFRPTLLIAFGSPFSIVPPIRWGPRGQRVARSGRAIRLLSVDASLPADLARFMDLFPPNGNLAIAQLLDHT